jgi:hypothetical protein
MFYKSTILFSFLILTLPAMASPVTYTYSGNDFEVVTGPYSTSDSISGFFSVASALPDNLAFTPDDVTLTSYSFTDGVQTFSSISPPTNVFFEIGTDASGNINKWDITLGSSSPDNSLSTFSLGSDSGQNGGSLGEELGSPGTWTMSGSTSSVPEPQNVALLGVGLAAIGVFRQRLRRKIA